MSKTTIYYFSATGNSLAAARYLAKLLDVGEPVSIPGSLINADAYIDARGAKAVGFVFPVQRATIPEMLRGFIQSMPVDPNCYYFAVSTYTLFGSNEFWDIDELLATQGGMLNYAAGVRMMGNVGLKQPSDTAIKHRLEHMKRRIDEIAAAVAYRQENYFPRANKVLGKAVRAFTNQRRRNIVFHIDQRCKGCGICAQVCPAQNIQLTQKGSTVAAPIRSDKCEACMACVHWCPAAAISTPTRLHMSYHNPTVTPEELHAPLVGALGEQSAEPSPNQTGEFTPNYAPDLAADLEAAQQDAELAATLRDDLLTPADIDDWLSEVELSVLPATQRRTHSKPEPHQLAMSDAEIMDALASLEE